jgi:hypothetical protein
MGEQAAMSKLPEDTTGQVNGWYCATCGRVTYGIHLHHGVTPMFLGCRATPDCEGMAASLKYPWNKQFTSDDRLPAWLAKPGVGVTVEWYRPEQIIQAMRRSGEAEHVERGGLLLRPLTDAGMRLLERKISGD